mgnify:CR=1 FL=1
MRFSAILGDMQPNQPRTPKQSRSIATKERLFEAARELFAEEGYHHTNTKKIAARGGIAVGSFYAYYRNKKAVFLEVIRSYYRRIEEEAFGGISDLMGRVEGAASTPSEGPAQNDVTAPNAVRTPQDAARFLNGMVRKLYEAHDISPRLHREITGMRYSDPEVAALIEEEEEKTVGRIQALLAAFRPLLQCEDLEAAARIVHRAAEEVIHSVKIFGSPVEPERLLAELQAMLNRYLFGAEPQ